MARIEISLEEYDSFKSKIESLELEIIKLDKQLKQIQNENVVLYSTLEDMVEDVNFFDRVFKWKETIHNAEEILKKITSKKETKPVVSKEVAEEAKGILTKLSINEEKRNDVVENIKKNLEVDVSTLVIPTEEVTEEAPKKKYEKKE